MKRLLAVVLLLICVLVPAVAVSANTQDTAELGAATYTPRLTAPSRSNGYYYSSKNILYAAGYGMPNCTAYAYGRAYEILGKKPNLCVNDANNWYNYNKTYKYYPYGQTPKVGAIACWRNAYGGHVAVVEKIEGNTVTLSHSEWAGRTFFLTTHKLGAPCGGAVSAGWTFQGYIYVYSGSTTTTPPKPVDGDVYRVKSYDGINLRKGAGLNYASVDVLYDGTEFVVKETKKADGYTWGKTTYDGVTGWCALDFCTLVSKYTPPATTAPTEPPTTVPETTAPTEPETETLPPDNEESLMPTYPDMDAVGSPGDVNGDGKLSVSDATAIQKHVANMGVEIDKENADMNGDGKVSISDATYLQKVLAGIIKL